MEIARHVEEICMNCEFYNLRKGGGPWCDWKKEYLPRYLFTGDAYADPPGAGTCQFWVPKKGDNEHGRIP